MFTLELRKEGSRELSVPVFYVGNLHECFHTTAPCPVAIQLSLGRHRDWKAWRKQTSDGPVEVRSWSRGCATRCGTSERTKRRDLMTRRCKCLTGPRIEEALRLLRIRAMKYLEKLLVQFVISHSLLPFSLLLYPSLSPDNICFWKISTTRIHLPLPPQRHLDLQIRHTTHLSPTNNTCP